MIDAGYEGNNHCFTRKKYIVPTTIFRKLISEHSFFYWGKVLLSRPLQQRQYFHVDACLKMKKASIGLICS